jgi:oligosaccharide repeat unit polymerase
MLIFFFVGSLFVSIKTKHYHNENQENSINKNKHNLRSFYVLIILIIIFRTIDSLVIIKGILDDIPIWEVRRWGLGAYGIDTNPLVDRRSFIEEVFRVLVLKPFWWLVPPVVAFNLFNIETKKKHTTLLVLSLLALVLGSFSGGGGRLVYIYFFGCFFFAFQSLSNKSHFKQFNMKRYKKYAYTMFVFALIMVLLITNVRIGMGTFIKHTYTYFALAPTLLSIWLSDLMESTPLFGMLTFFGAHSHFFRIFQFLGLEVFIPQTYYETFHWILNAEVYRDVGAGNLNAFVTPIYYFFIDGGYLFVCLASMISGIAVVRVFNNFKHNINIKTFTFYSIILNVVFLSFMNIQTINSEFWLSLIFAYILLRPSKKQILLKH